MVSKAQEGMAAWAYLCNTEKVADMEEPDMPDVLQTSADLMATLQINRRTPIDQALLITILGLQIHTGHAIRELQREVAIMALDTSALDTAVQQAVALIEQLAANSDDTAAQQAVDADVAALNSAVAANTPAAPEPAPTA